MSTRGLIVVALIAVSPVGTAIGQDDYSGFAFEREALILSPDSVDCGVLVNTWLGSTWRRFLSDRRRVLKCVTRAIAAGREVRTTYVEFGVDTVGADTTILLGDQSAIVLHGWDEGVNPGNRPFAVSSCPDVLLSREAPGEQFALNASNKVLTGLRCVQNDALGELVYPQKSGTE